MGDGREKGTLWETYIRTRALDNQIFIVAAVNQGRSCVVSPKGEILAMSGNTQSETAIAECDLDADLTNFTGRPIGPRYVRMRRADLFDPLLKSLWKRTSRE